MNKRKTHPTRFAASSPLDNPQPTKRIKARQVRRIQAALSAPDRSRQVARQFDTPIPAEVRKLRVMTYPTTRQGQRKKGRDALTLARQGASIRRILRACGLSVELTREVLA